MPLECNFGHEMKFTKIVCTECVAVRTWPSPPSLSKLTKLKILQTSLACASANNVRCRAPGIFRTCIYKRRGSVIDHPSQKIMHKKSLHHIFYCTSGLTSSSFLNKFLQGLPRQILPWNNQHMKSNWPRYAYTTEFWGPMLDESYSTRSVITSCA